ncbi:MAG: type II toxin-antitoxin system RelB/DinJ family antitoxin [Clostridiales bacterium]|jgi:DNA-damage-inducible protein J|nr:type II toxin-antitoxin system RelB/DinJ family antitoxin [Clostridiales bacterium]
MSQVNVNIRMDEALKRDFETVCGKMGLTMTTAITVFAKAVSSRKEIPFRITAQPQINEITLASERALSREWLQPEEDEEWGHFPGEQLNVGDVAGIAHEWANPNLIQFEKSAWPEAAANKERHAYFVGAQPSETPRY